MFVQQRRALPIALALSVALACSEAGVGPRVAGTPASVRIEATRTLLVEGDSVRLEFSFVDDAGRVLGGVIPAAPPRWTSATGAVLQVNPDGLILGLAPGWAAVVLEVDGLTDSLMVRVDARTITLRVTHAYLVQAVQRREGGIPLVAGRDAVLRVFVEGDQVDNRFAPDVHLQLYHHGVPVLTAILQAQAQHVPTDFDETRMMGSWNLRVPADLVRPGLGFRVVLDPDETVPRTAASATHLPADGSMQPVIVHELPPHRVRFVPIRLESGQTGKVDPDNVGAFLDLFRRIYPVHAVEADVRPPYATSTVLAGPEGWIALLRELWLVQQAEGAEDYYYYGVVPTTTGGGGFAMVGRPVAIGADNLTTHPHAGTLASAIFAHEAGHNFGRGHAPCGVVQAWDANYPHMNGTIGVTGYDLDRHEVRGPSLRDVMSYCHEWISDYTYEGVLAFRLANSGVAARATEDRIEPVLMIWGQVSPDGNMVLEPAFELRSRPYLPERAGPYALEGLDDTGAPLFKITFAGDDVSHTDVQLFAFTLPIQEVSMDRLVRIRLTGPRGSVEQVQSAEPLAALIRDVDTGMVLRFARRSSMPDALHQPKGEVLLSYGTKSVRVRSP